MCIVNSLRDAAFVLLVVETLAESGQFRREEGTKPRAGETHKAGPAQGSGLHFLRFIGTTGGNPIACDGRRLRNDNELTVANTRSSTLTASRSFILYRSSPLTAAYSGLRNAPGHPTKREGRGPQPSTTPRCGPAMSISRCGPSSSAVFSARRTLRPVQIAARMRYARWYLKTAMRART